MTEVATHDASELRYMDNLIAESVKTFFAERSSHFFLGFKSIIENSCLLICPSACVDFLSVQAIVPC